MSDQPQRPARLGLALSGGGFRASLFHIGVLARLAELDLLREVQVLSTVSGGSIVGALYYLHVRRLLQAKADAAITRADYVGVVDELARDFTAAVGANLRMRAFADWRANWRMFHDRKYSRSDRMAELYEEYLYATVAGVAPGQRVELPRLTIQPVGEPAGFHPFEPETHGRTPNDRRRNKIPVLVINATTLNTGHSFQFTATWLGEPEALAHHDNIDCNLRLRRACYDSLAPTDKYRRLPLGVAVAASAAVPGIFPPLALTELYQDGADELTPQLVDGGVHDNQGIEALLDPSHPCTHLLVSDASGQMADSADAPTRLFGVVQRSNDALMDRVREEQYAVAHLLERCGSVRQLVFLHLKEDLLQREITWRGGADKPAQVTDTGGRTAYGVDRHVQEALAGVRTDLDAFSGVEARALIADGYLIAQHAIPATLGAALRGSDAPPLDASLGWCFLDMRAPLGAPLGADALGCHLRVAHRLVGKSLHTEPRLAWSQRTAVRLALAAALLVVVVGASWGLRDLLFALATLYAVVSLAIPAARACGWRRLEGRLRSARVRALGLPLAIAFSAAVAVHLRTCTAWRMRSGARAWTPVNDPTDVDVAA
ncbi:MAG: patatin-like phospholipase family protein [Deltaproteobacteria bacterium]|nr:patatin-like phospholipase family protein [Deltaproteobacteria bacterium]